MQPITHIVVHYAATYPDQNTTAADIDRMHKARGWQGIGYHYFIRRDGTVEKGRDESEIGAHVGGQNTGKIGICWAGGVDRATGANVGVDNRTEAQNEALIQLINSILSRHPKAKVVGHRDLAPTQCPGFDVIPWWAAVKAEVSAPPAPSKPAPSKPKEPVMGVEKAIVAILGGIVTIASAHGYSLGLDEETITTIAPIITAVLVYFIPNSQKDT